MNYTAIDSHGEIVSILSVPDQEHLELNTPAGCTTVPGTAPHDSYWTGTAWIARTARPTSVAEWNPVSKLWFDPRTLATAKQQRWTLLKSKRDLLANGTFWHDGEEYQVNEPRIAMFGVDASEAGQQSIPWSVDWVLADDSVLTLNGPQFLALVATMREFLAGIWATSQTLRNAIYALATIEEVDAVVWPGDAQPGLTGVAALGAIGVMAVRAGATPHIAGVLSTSALGALDAVGSQRDVRLLLPGLTSTATPGRLAVGLG
jgi:hypothetical protein